MLHSNPKSPISPVHLSCLYPIELYGRKTIPPFPLKLGISFISFETMFKIEIDLKSHKSLKRLLNLEFLRKNKEMVSALHKQQIWGNVVDGSLEKGE